MFINPPQDAVQLVGQDGLEHPGGRAVTPAQQLDNGNADAIWIPIQRERCERTVPQYGLSAFRDKTLEGQGRRDIAQAKTPLSIEVEREGSDLKAAPGEICATTPEDCANGEHRKFPNREGNQPKCVKSFPGNWVLPRENVGNCSALRVLQALDDPAHGPLTEHVGLAVKWPQPRQEPQPVVIGQALESWRGVVQGIAPEVSRPVAFNLSE